MPKRATENRSTYHPDIDYDAEVWRPVPGFTDMIASDKGRVATVVGHLNGNGYVTCHVPAPIPGLPAAKVGVHRPGYRTGVHQIVARTFHGPPLEGQTQVNHKDGDPRNNAISNLEWCTQSENIRHSHRMRKERKNVSS